MASDLKWMSLADAFAHVVGQVVSPISASKELRERLADDRIKAKADSIIVIHPMTRLECRRSEDVFIPA